MIEYNSFGVEIKVGDVKLEATYEKGVFTLTGLTCDEAQSLVEQLEQQVVDTQASLAKIKGKGKKAPMSRFDQLRNEIWDNSPFGEAKALEYRARVNAARFGIDALLPDEIEELLEMILAETIIPVQKSGLPRQPLAPVAVTTQPSFFEKMEALVTEKDALNEEEYGALFAEVSDAYRDDKLTQGEYTSLTRSLNHRYPQKPVYEEPTVPLWLSGIPTSGTASTAQQDLFGAPVTKETGAVPTRYQVDSDPEMYGIEGRDNGPQEPDHWTEVGRVQDEKASTVATLSEQEAPEWATSMDATQATTLTCEGPCGKEIPEADVVIGPEPDFKVLCGACAELDAAVPQQAGPVVTITNIETGEVVPFAQQRFDVRQEFQGGADIDQVGDEFARAIRELQEKEKSAPVVDTDTGEVIGADAEEEFQAEVAAHRAMNPSQELEHAMSAAQQLEQQLQRGVVPGVPVVDKIVCAKCGDGFFGDKAYRSHSCYTASNVAAATKALQSEARGESEPHQVFPAEAPTNEFMRDLYMDIHGQISALSDVSLEDAAQWKKRIMAFKAENNATDLQAFELTKLLGARMRSVGDQPVKKPRAPRAPKAETEATPAQAKAPVASTGDIASLDAVLLVAATVREATHLLMAHGVTTLETIFAKLSEIQSRSKLAAVRDLRGRIEAAMPLFSQSK